MGFNFSATIGAGAAVAPQIINANRYDYSSIEIAIDGLPILGQDIISVSYKQSLKSEKVYGGSPMPRGRTRGRYEADASMEITKEVYGNLIEALSQDTQYGYMEKPFNITVTYQDVGGPLIVDELIGCRLGEDEDSHKSGPEGLTVRCTLDPVYIVRNGRNAVGEQLGIDLSV